jgi:hypothetical protein
VDHAQPKSQSAEPVYRFDATRWSHADRITVAATLLLSISLFVPWFTVSASVSGSTGGFSASGSANGLVSHGYQFVTFALALMILACLMGRAGLRDRRMFGIPHKGLLTLTTAINLLLVLTGFLSRPVNISGISGLMSVSVGWNFGAFTLIASAVAFIYVATSVLPRSVTT